MDKGNLWKLKIKTYLNGLIVSISGHRISEKQEDTGDGGVNWNKNYKGKVYEWVGKSTNGCVQRQQQFPWRKKLTSTPIVMQLTFSIFEELFPPCSGGRYIQSCWGWGTHCFNLGQGDSKISITDIAIK